MRQHGVAAALLLLFTFKEHLSTGSPEDGSARLAALLSSRHSAIEEMKAGLAAGASRPEWMRLRASIDALAHQRDAAWSGLYWHTDLAEALAAAKREGKPVLSLRLLGSLEDELSCANSRFFRTALYANTAISDDLRRNWILHWESVRPVPIVTIDFGDGRTLVRTITGNSLHYVLDAEGHATDVIPGLWGPGDFLRMIKAMRETADPAHGRNSPFKENPLFSLSKASIPSSFSLDANSVSLMRAKSPHMNEAAFGRMVSAFERSLAEDTRRNVGLRATILPWLPGASLPALTERIYREAFLTPRSDPWLGLVTPDVYVAIEGDPVPTAGAPPAMNAGALAASKMIVEKALLARVVTPGR